MNFQLRRKKLLEKINEGTIILFSGREIHFSADEAYPFAVNRNFYYLTGIKQKDTYLILNKQKEKLFILPNDEKLARWVGYNLFVNEAKDISMCDDVETFENEDFLKEIAQQEKVIYLDFEETSFLGGVNQAKRIQEELLSFNKNLTFKNIHDEILSLRAVKDEDEIKALRYSIEITKKSLEAVMSNITKLKTEKECQALFEERIASLANARTSFPTIAASGMNATTLHYSINNQEFKYEDMILMDLGASVNLYNADITRTYPHLGKYSSLQKQIYEIVLNCNKKIIEMIKPGLTILDLQNETKRLLADGLLKAKIIENNDELSEYYFHNISHHLGLDTHDPMNRTIPLVPGNVITVEPGLYIRKLGIGVRIEDDVLVTETGSDNLSKDIIKEVKDIETFIEEHK